jgi:hypothetical protein
MNRFSRVNQLVVLAATVSPLLVATAWGDEPFRFEPVGDKALKLMEGDRPVLVYNQGVQLKAGVQEKYARSSYIHPIYGLDGEVITDDFPADHLHHRGLFWAWPHVRIDNKEYDLWTLIGIAHRFERWLSRRTEPDMAILGVENGWYVGDRKVMKERIWLRVHRPAADGRALDLDCTWTPLVPVTLTGAEGKSYGGLTLRFAPGTEADTVITVPAGRTTEDLYMSHQPWTDLTRGWTGQQKEPSGAAIFVHPSHPDFPPTWLTRHYGALCLGWPGVQPKPFPADVPIRCCYRVWVHRGRPDAARLAETYEAYKAAPLPPAPEPDPASN